jgi:transcriptional regulator with XRE-family HTH domain
MTLPETIAHGNTRYFPKSTDMFVLQWCSARGLTLDELATQVGVSRLNLGLILKGVDPVTQALERKLRTVIDGN